MAKKKGFDISGFMDQESLELLMEKGKESLKPTEAEVKFVKESSGDLQDIPVKNLVDYRNHTFKVFDNEDMADLVESIDKMGIVVPISVRKLDDERYEIVSGHRRVHAATILGLEAVPCLITDVDDATADILSVDTNLHRKELLPSEKAKSYDLRIKAMRKKGLMNTEEESDSTYAAKFAEEIKSSRANITRYRKLLKLTPALLEMVDNKEIPVNAGAALADISKDDQKCVIEALKEAKNPITIENSEKIVTAARSGLTKEKVFSILDGDFTPRKKKAPGAPMGIKEKNIKASYPASIKSLTASEKEAFIVECISEYVKSHKTWKGHDIG